MLGQDLEGRKPAPSNAFLTRVQWCYQMCWSGPSDVTKVLAGEGMELLEGERANNNVQRYTGNVTGDLSIQLLSSRRLSDSSVLLGNQWCHGYSQLTAHVCRPAAPWPGSMHVGSALSTW